MNQTDSNGNTPLYIAALNGNELIVTQLLEKGADVNQVSANGQTPLYVAAEKGHASVVDQLLKKGATISQKNKKWMPLIIAAGNGHRRVVTLLLEKGTDVNQANSNGRTPLASAMESSDSKIVARLLKAGARLDAEQNEKIVLLYSHLQEWLWSGEYEACLILSDYRLNHAPELRIEERAMAYYAQGKLDKAFEYLEVLKSKNRQEDRAFIAYQFGYFKMEQGEFELAIKHYEVALQENKNHNWINYDKIQAELYKTGNPKSALEVLEGLPTLDPFLSKKEAVYIYHVKGFIYHQCLCDKKALSCFNKALELDEKNIFALAKRGFLFLYQGELNAGLKDLNAALAINPCYSGALARKGYGLALKECFDNAWDLFEHSLRVNPTHFETLLFKGASLILQKRLEEAKQCIEKTFAVSISRSLLIAQHTCNEVKKRIGDYALEYSAYDKEKLKKTLSVLSWLAISSEKKEKEIKIYLKKAYLKEELNIFLRGISRSSSLYSALCQIVLSNAKKQQTKTGNLCSQLKDLTEVIEIEQLNKTKESVNEWEGILYTELIMVSFQNRYLKKEVQDHLTFHEREVEEKAKETSYGTHIAKQYAGIHFKYHDGTNPCYPAIEYMIGALYSMLAGALFYRTAPMEIVKFHRKDYARVLVASQTLKGINLFDFLTHYVEREPQYLEQFDDYSFSTMIITSLLSNPIDGKPDNYIVQFFQNKDKEERIKILGFDNDLVFGEPVVKIHQDRRAGERFVEVRNVFYFFPQMNKPIDPVVYKRLTENPPELLMLEFIKLLQKQDEHYKKLLQKEVLTIEEGKALQLPICFSRKKTLSIMCKKLRVIQQRLKDNQNLKHDELFQAIYPEVATHYRMIAEKNEGKPNAILQSIAELYAASAPTVEEANIILEKKSPIRMSQLAIETMKKEEYANRPHSLSKEVEKFVESIQFSTMSSEIQRKILEEIKCLEGSEKFTIRDCKKLDDNLLRELTESSMFKKLIW